MTDLIIVGDEAWLPEEWEREQRRRARDREQARARYAADPERAQEAHRRWRDRNRDQWRAYHREWMRDYRLRKRYGAPPVASLHELRCTGPTRRTGCRCQKIPMFRREAA